MGRGGVPYLSYTALVLLSTLTSTNASDLWNVDINNGPAPAPEDGPPFSRFATRDRALLPYQVIGVVGAYLAFVAVLGTALFTFGRRLRKQALSPAERLTEMVKPMGMFMADQSPARAHLSPFSRLQRRTSQASSMRSKLSGAASPMDSTVRFDMNVIEEDKKKSKEELTNIYNQLYEAEDQRSALSVEITERRTVPALSMPQHPRRGPAHLRVDLGPFNRHDTQPASPRTPLSAAIRAVYPPAPGLSNYEQSPSPIRTRRSDGSPELRQGPSGDHSTSPPQDLRGRLARDRLRKALKISAPLRDDNSDGARTPLSPRFYTDPGVPPEPPSTRTVGSQWHAQGNDYEEYNRLERAREVPLEHPQRPFKIDGLPQSPNRSVRSEKRHVANGSGALPLRQFADQQRATPVSPTSTWSAHPISPGLTSPAIRHNEVIVDKRKIWKGLPSGMAHMGQTPYTAAFFDTMITPVTPHFTTRAERIQKEKEEKALRGAMTAEDQVIDEREIWEDAY